MDELLKNFSFRLMLLPERERETGEIFGVSIIHEEEERGSDKAKLYHQTFSLSIHLSIESALYVWTTFRERDGKQNR